MFSIFCTYFFVLICFITLLYTSGHFLFKLLHINIEGKATAAFAKLLTSLTIFVVFSAIFFTKGVTVMLFFLPLLLALVWKTKLSAKNDTVANVQTFDPLFFSGLALGILFIFCCKFFLVYNPDGDIPYLPHGDVVFYSNLTDFILHFKNENSSLDYIYPAGNSPYHYFEIWLGAALGFFTNLNTALLMILVVFATGPVLIWLGLCALLEHFKPTLKFKDYLFCLLGVFLTGIVFKAYTMIGFMEGIGSYTCNAINYNKLFPIYLYTIAALLFFIKHKDTEAIFCLLAVPVTFISTAVGLFSAIFVWLVIRFLVSRKASLFSFSMLMVTSIGIFVFYKVTPAISTHISTNFLDTISKLSEAAYIKTMINIVGGTSLQFIILYIPYVLFYFINVKFKLKDILFNSVMQLFILINAIGLLGWAILHDSTSTIQIYVNFAVVSFSQFAFFILVKIYTNNNQLKWYNVLFILFALSIGFKTSFSDTGTKVGYEHSQVYLKDVINNSSNLSLKGAFILTEEDYSKINFSYISNFTILGSYLIYGQSKTFPLSVSPFSYKLSSDKIVADREHSSLVNSSFWKYVLELKSKNKFESIEKSQVQFIEEFNINYLICTKNVVLTDALNNKIKKVITDANTGERFCLLK